MLWLCLFFSRLSFEIFSRGQAKDGPFAVSDGNGTRSTLIAVNPAAAACGVNAGMREAAAHALVDGLHVRVRDETAECRALARIAAWSGQFTSLVSLAPPQAVLLEIGGSLQLFHGAPTLIARIQREIKPLGYTPTIAVAPTPLGAFLFARAGWEVEIDNPAQLARALAGVPIACLDVSSTVARALGDLGLHTLDDCLRLPRAGLARRFGPDFVESLDRALGRAPDPRPPYVAPARFDAGLVFPAEVGQTEALLFGAQRLLLELEGFLRARDSGIQKLMLKLLHARPPATELALRLAAPRREAPHLLSLLRERLARLELREPVLEVHLQARRLLPWTGQSAGLFDGHGSLREPVSFLLERLETRLGASAVHGIATRPEHRPEHAWRGCKAGEAGGDAARAARPMWLLPAPLALEQREGAPYHGGTLQIEQGPERIESGWWDQDATRDYFIARNPLGARLWIFRERDVRRRWFLHGIFA